VKNFSYIHTDFFKFYTCLLKFKKIIPEKALQLMFDEIKVITNNKIIVPTYNYDFTKSKIYDYYRSKSEVGFFSEYFRKTFKDYRTNIPIFSDCSNIKLKNKNDSLNPFGKNSTFDNLTKNSGKILMYGANFAPSYIMYVENCITNGPRYRFIKEFEGSFIKKKIKKKIKIKFFCRPLNIYFKYDLTKIKKDLFKEGILKVYKNEYNLKYYSFKTKDFKEFCLNKIRKNNFYFLDKKTHLILKKHLGKKYRIQQKDFE
jgi:aminoglycoside N3'-acetyltransferase